MGNRQIEGSVLNLLLNVIAGIFVIHLLKNKLILFFPKELFSSLAIAPCPSQ